MKPVDASCPATGRIRARAAIARLRRAGLRTSIIEGTLTMVHMTLTSAHFITGYALMLGANDFHLGVMNSLCPLVQFFQIAAAYVTNLVGSRRLVCAAGIVIFRGMFPVFGVLPFVPGLSSGGRVWTFLLLLLFANIAHMFILNPWNVWMGELIPVRIRGRYLGTRSALVVAAGVATMFLGSRALDFYRASGRENQGFLVLFSVAGVFAVAGLLMLLRQWEPPMRRVAPPALRNVIAGLRLKNFGRLCTFYFLWNAAVGLSMSFYTKLMLQYLHMSYSQIYLYAAATSLVGFALGRRIGRVMDAAGTKTTLLVCAGGVAFTPLLWLFAEPGRLWILAVDTLATGSLWTGVGLAGTNLPLLLTPDENKQHYMGLFTTIANLGIGLAALLSGKLAMWTAGFSLAVPWMRQPLQNYHLIIAVSVLCRIACVGFLMRVHESRSRSLGECAVMFKEWCSAALAAIAPKKYPDRSVWD